MRFLGRLQPQLLRFRPSLPPLFPFSATPTTFVVRLLLFANNGSGRKQQQHQNQQQQEQYNWQEQQQHATVEEGTWLLVRGSDTLARKCSGRLPLTLFKTIDVVIGHMPIHKLILQRQGRRRTLPACCSFGGHCVRDFDLESF